jgi:signal transduction histidine kinase
MKSKKRIHSLIAITLTLGLFTLLLWGTSMFCITNAVAQNYYQLLLNESNSFADYAALSGRLKSLFDENGTYEYKQTMPGYTEYCMLDALHNTNRKNLNFNVYHTTSLSGWDYNDSLNVQRDESVPMQTAVIFLDGEGNFIHHSGDFIYFRYVTDDVWEQEQEEQISSGNAWIDLSKDEDFPLFRSMYSGVKSIRDIRVLRITGRFEGTELRPMRMDYITEGMVRNAVEQTEPDEHEIYDDGREHYSYTYTVSGLDHAGLLEWQTIFDDVAGEKSSGEPVTVYAMYPEANIYDAGNPVTHQGNEYENLYELLSTTGVELYNISGQQLYGYNECRLDEVIVFAVRTFRDLKGYDFSSSEPLPEPEFVMLTAIESRPLLAAISKLMYVYIGTFILAVLGVLIIRKIIKRKLILPLWEISEGISGGWTHIPAMINAPAKWREPYELSQHYLQTQDKLRMGKNEITRLNTALDYAKAAEQNRRQMTSNIAHELKTPLAIIHSYAEGLKERIAEDKRDKYLDVILSESQRMDAVVLEMLDLSRLEAGKVKLSRDDFSIAELTCSVFEKLEMAAEAKNLHIGFDLLDDCIVSADEARISQVIENFATNAIKYTPINGNIHVRIFAERSGTTFAISNDCEPLSGDALNKVWDTFYRTNEARSGGGTGLGLAIAKNIIDLHGGKCSVQNTKTGVEFRFTI